MCEDGSVCFFFFFSSSGLSLETDTLFAFHAAFGFLDSVVSKSPCPVPLFNLSQYALAAASILGNEKKSHYRERESALLHLVTWGMTIEVAVSFTRFKISFLSRCNKKNCWEYGEILVQEVPRGKAWKTHQVYYSKSIENVILRIEFVFAKDKYAL